MNYIRITEENIDKEGANATDEYTLLDARQHPQQYKELFCQYCRELSESDPTISEEEIPS